MRPRIWALEYNPVEECPIWEAILQSMLIGRGRKLRTEPLAFEQRRGFETSLAGLVLDSAISSGLGRAPPHCNVVTPSRHHLGTARQWDYTPADRAARTCWLGLSRAPVLSGGLRRKNSAFPCTPTWPLPPRPHLTSPKIPVEKACLTYEELYTVVCDSESVINSRPLTYLSEDQEDLVALTPAMFLQEIKENGVPDLDLIDSQRMNRRFLYRQRIRQELRKRFRRISRPVEEFSKSRKEDVIKEGDIVLIGDTNSKRIYWPLAKVIKLIPGRDERVKSSRSVNK
ncbi:DUF5641 domain-containing protein [Trichonephila clavipes]|nr:DUF5641 domain-containing protein [Trichonephila clavipes]